MNFVVNPSQVQLFFKHVVDTRTYTPLLPIQILTSFNGIETWTSNSRSSDEPVLTRI